MYQLLYISEATAPLTDERLKELLTQAQHWNEQVGITGVLLYNGEHFAQVIEGSAEAIDDLYGKLLRDVRHHSVVTLAHGRIAARRFGDWHMSFHAVEPAYMARVRGYCPPERLQAHYQHLHAPDELLLEIIEGFMHNPGLKL